MFSRYFLNLAPVDPARQRFRTAYLTARTDANGQYSVSGAPGEYFAFARRREDLPPILSEEFVREQAATAKRVVISPGQSTRMDLREQ